MDALDHFRLGSWLCKNAKTIESDRTTYSSKTTSALKRANAFKFEGELKNAILAACRSLAFLHSQGHLQTCPARDDMSASLLIVLQNSEIAAPPISRQKTKRAAVADRCAFRRATEVTGGFIVC